jgi:hypothetical protein
MLIRCAPLKQLRRNLEKTKLIRTAPNDCYMSGIGPNPSNRHGITYGWALNLERNHELNDLLELRGEIEDAVEISNHKQILF